MDIKPRIKQNSKHPFKAKFESMCPYCFLTIREGMDVRYAKNEVVHVQCADKMIKQIADAVGKSREADGYLF